MPTFCWLSLLFLVQPMVYVAIVFTEGAITYKLNQMKINKTKDSENKNKVFIFLFKLKQNMS